MSKTIQPLYHIRAESSVDGEVYGNQFVNISYMSSKGRRCASAFFQHDVEEGANKASEIEKKLDCLGQIYMRIRLPGLINRITADHATAGEEKYDLCLSRDANDEAQLMPPGAYKVAGSKTNCIEAPELCPFWTNGAALALMGDLDLQIGECTVDHLYMIQMSLWLELCCPPDKKQHWKRLCGFEEIDAQADTLELQMRSMRRQTMLVPLAFNFFSRVPGSVRNPSNSLPIVGLAYHTVKIKHNSSGQHSDINVTGAGVLCRVGDSLGTPTIANGVKVSRAGTDGVTAATKAGDNPKVTGTAVETIVRPGEEYDADESTTIAKGPGIDLQKSGSAADATHGNFLQSASQTVITAADVDNFIKYKSTVQWADRLYVSKQYMVSEAERAQYKNFSSEMPVRVNRQESFSVSADDTGKVYKWENEWAHPLTHIHFVAAAKSRLAIGDYFSFGGVQSNDDGSIQPAIVKCMEKINGEEVENLDDAEQKRQVLQEAFNHSSEKRISGVTYSLNYDAGHETNTFNGSRVNHHDFMLSFDGGLKTQFTDGIQVFAVATACNVYQQKEQMGGLKYAI